MSIIRARNRAQVFFTGTHNNFEIIFAFEEPDGMLTHPMYFVRREQ